MESVFLVAAGLMAAVILLQTIVLVVLYLRFRAFSRKIHGFTADGYQLIPPMKKAVEDFQILSGELREVTSAASEQMQNLEASARTKLRIPAGSTGTHSADRPKRLRVLPRKVLRPIRHCSAVIAGIREGCRVLLRTNETPSGLPKPEKNSAA